MMGIESKLPAKEHRSCPYCDEEIAEAQFPYCDACGVQVFYCPQCRKPVRRDVKECPACGTKITGAAGASKWPKKKK